MAKTKKETYTIKDDTNSVIERLKKKSTVGLSYAGKNLEELRIKNWIDTGNYVLNALISGDIYKGLPGNKIVQLAGPSSTGKTFLAQDMIKSAQKQGYNIIYYDTEGAQDLDSLQNRGIDLEKFILIKLTTVEELILSISEITEGITENDKVLVVLDSLGQLSTSKEIEDAKNKKTTADMTRAKQIKKLTRMFTVDFNVKNIPFVIINHTYQVIGAYGNQSKASGGTGIEFSPTVSIFLSKKKDKNSKDEIIGAIITAKAEKNRIAKPYKKVQLNISYSSGLNRYSGLLQYALEGNFIIKKGKTFYYKGEELEKGKINKNFFEELLKEGLAEYLNKEFKYSSSVSDIVDDLDSETEEEKPEDTDDL